MMNDEKRLSEDELAAIAFTLEKASPGEWSTDGIQILCDEQPIALMAVNDYTAGNALLFIRATRFISDLLQHTRALENELHIERAQSARGDWLGD